MPLTPKELLEESRARRTYRSFSPEPVDLREIRDCILTAGTAPSGANMQPWHFTVITDPEKKRELRAASEAVEQAFYREKISDVWRRDLQVLKTDWEKPFLTEAPCLIAVFKEQYRLTEDGKKAPNYYVTESCGIAVGLLINALRNAGYVSLTYTPAPPAYLRELLHRPENEVPMMILAVGRKDPGYELPPITKKTFGEIADVIGEEIP